MSDPTAAATSAAPPTVVETGFEQATLAAWRGQLGLVELLEAVNRLSAAGRAPLAAVL